MARKKTAFIIGRFQHIHKGHVSLIDTALTFADVVLLGIGSAQEHGTKRNPFSYELRRELIEKIYHNEIANGRLIIFGINDLTNENDNNAQWGRYLLDQVRKFNHGLNPDLMVYGNDNCRSKWFDDSDISKIAEYIESRAQDTTSGTKCRDLLIKNEIDTWKMLTSYEIHDYAETLRDILLKIEGI